MATTPKPANQPVNIRFPDDLRDALIDRAVAEDRTMAATIREACRYYLANTTPLTGSITAVPDRGVALLHGEPLQVEDGIGNDQ